MFVKPPPVGTTVRDQQPRRKAVGPPVACCSDLWGEPNLPVKGPQHLGNIDDLGLQLDDEEGASPRVPREAVDDAPLTVDRERRLRGELPTTRIREPSGEGLMERGMACIHDPIELSATPAQGVVGPSIEGKGDRPDLRHRDAIPKTALHPRDVGFGHAGP